jgi:A/G-specific adenine glycosylase
MNRTIDAPGKGGIVNKRMAKKLTPEQIKKFQKTIYSFFKTNRRDFAWRNTTDPYKIVVSEIMLQQTQVERVKTKYQEFIKTFPNFKTLATASLKDVLTLWQGMGYNRRALYLHEIATKVTKDFGGTFPKDPLIIRNFKGIGLNTVGSICAFAFNIPTVFIETNIRSVFIHYFFPRKKAITDQQLLPLIAQTLDQKNPREWYFALMDYGVYLKKHFPNPSKKSAHHVKQSKFAGSDRQIRGALIKFLTQNAFISLADLKTHFPTIEQQRLRTIIKQLLKEKLVTQKASKIFLG